MSIDSTPRRVRRLQPHLLDVGIELRLSDDGRRQAVPAQRDGAHLPVADVSGHEKKAASALGGPRRVPAASSSNVVIRGTKARCAAARRRSWPPVFEEEPARQPARLGAAETPSARRKFSRMPALGLAQESDREGVPDEIDRRSRRASAASGRRSGVLRKRRVRKAVARPTSCGRAAPARCASPEPSPPVPHRPRTIQSTALP